MTKAVDPFEEFLRKKKVEMLEQRFRGEPGAATPARKPEAEPQGQEQVQGREEGEVAAQKPADPEARLNEEMDEFFQAGQHAGAEFFNRAETGIPGEQVEEIRDALDEVFEEDAALPQTEEADETFGHFFREVQEKYEEAKQKSRPSGLARARQEAIPGEEERALDMLSEEIMEEADFLQKSAPVAVAGVGAFETRREATRPEPRVAPAAPPVAAPSRLSLAEILGKPLEQEKLLQRIDLLSRLVAKLAERARLPESEIIEALIKADVEF